MRRTQRKAKDWADSLHLNDLNEESEKIDVYLSEDYEDVLSGSSVRDNLVIDCCNKHHMTMDFTGMRLFQH